MKRIWLVLFVAGLLAPAWAKDGVKMTFAPPAALVATETEKETTVRELAAPAHGLQQKDTYVTEKRVRYEIHTSVKGFTVSETLLSVRVLHDGAADQPDPFDRCLLNNPVTFSLDGTGKLLRVLGVEKVITQGHDDLSTDDQKELGQMLDAVKLAQSFRSDWQVSVGALLGRTVKHGAAWSAQGDTFLPDGTLGTYTETTKAGDTAALGERTGVALHFANDLDKKAFGRALSRVFNANEPDGPPVTWKVTEASQQGERLVDTTLLLDLHATQQTVTRAQASGPDGKPMTMTLTSTAESTLVFGDAPDPSVWRAPATAT